MVSAVLTVSTFGDEVSSSITKLWKVVRSLATQCSRKSDSPDTIQAARTIGQAVVRSAKAFSSASDWWLRPIMQKATTSRPSAGLFSMAR